MSQEIIQNIKNAERFFIKKPFYHSYNIGISIALLYAKSFETFVNVGVSGSHFLIPVTNLFKKVLGFEPQDIYYDILSEISNYGNIECYNIALSNVSDIKTFYNLGNKGESSFIFQKWWKEKNLNIVETEIVSNKLDDFLCNRNLKIDYLKIDAEEEDPLILEGSFETIKVHKPIIQIETVNKQCVELIQNIGYIEYCLDTDLFPKEIYKSKIDKYFIHPNNVKRNYHGIR